MDSSNEMITEALKVIDTVKQGYKGTGKMAARRIMNIKFKEGGGFPLSIHPYGARVSDIWFGTPKFPGTYLGNAKWDLTGMTPKQAYEAIKKTLAEWINP